MRCFESDEIIKLVSVLVGSVHPVADSNYDLEIMDNTKTMIDIGNWLLGEMSETAGERKSPYGSVRDIGERAYSALLEWKEWLSDIEEELA